MLFNYFICLFKLYFFIKGLKLLLNATDDKIIDIDKIIESKTDVSWLLTSLPQLPNFPAFKSQVNNIHF